MMLLKKFFSTTSLVLSIFQKQIAYPNRIGENIAKNIKMINKTWKNMWKMIPMNGDTASMLTNLNHANIIATAPIAML